MPTSPNENYGLCYIHIVLFNSTIWIC